MAEASSANLGGGCEEKRHEGSSPQSVPPGTTISRVKLLDTMVDTFLQKLVAAGSYQRFTDCYKRFYQLQPDVTQRIYDKFIAQLQTSIRPPRAVLGARQAAASIISPFQMMRLTFQQQLATWYTKWTGSEHSYEEQVLGGERPWERPGKPAQLGTRWACHRVGLETEPSSTRAFRVPYSLCPMWPSRRPSGIPEKDLHSVMAPYFLQQRDTLRRHVQKQEAENQQLADAVLAGRRQVEELQLQVQARQQAWQALHREQRELVAVLREPE
ncbi:PREDICTED: polyamine-modulated factor 1 [Mandrillus leucophaeus]|uniref:polyamine-modulated factor 1 n=1 Tax=Mandrillus leucophaeus TaxID=9568 RepID=UPI0005F4FAAC|nr:PREDICTED: polyamine-modulated factor 1 [Mandrillus leucophaeus]